MPSTNLVSPSPRRRRLLVFVIAYAAEKTLTSVLSRIPRRLFDEFDCEVLVVDDASRDRTFEIGSEYGVEHPEFPLVVLRNEFNQGYGGNQKVGYAYAISENFDFVAMVHGDGQYAPEELPRLLEPLREGRADAVFGSRMLTPGGARKGGMPLYKLLGNKILTRLQNRLLRTHLSEFHSGYRIYSVDVLRSIPFQLNSNDFHFDTEIIIQLVNAGRRIVELPIPTFYGDEVCHVDGLKYAKDVLLATAKNAVHRTGLLYQRRYDTAPRDPARYELKLGYPSSHTYAIDAVSGGSQVIEIGSEPPVGPELAKKGCHVSFVPSSKLQGEPDFDARPFEYILLLDVIEHLNDPESFMEALRRQFDHSPKILVLTTPNVAFVVQRLMLLLGQFNYSASGILAKSHKRLFTFRGIQRLLRDNGYRVKVVRGIPAPFPKAMGDGPAARTAIAVHKALIGVSRTLFAYQIYLEAEATPGIEFLLRNAKASRAPSPRESSQVVGRPRPPLTGTGG
jgi:glycosyltransferase involved in cell wall biosynthesis